MAAPHLADAAPSAPGWDVISEFLAANEALGRVGVALVGSATGRSDNAGVELDTALQDAAAGLQRLARVARVDLQETP